MSGIKYPIDISFRFEIFLDSRFETGMNRMYSCRYAAFPFMHFAIGHGYLSSGLITLSTTPEPAVHLIGLLSQALVVRNEIQLMHSSGCRSTLTQHVQARSTKKMHLENARLMK